MVGSRNQIHTMARGFGRMPNGSLPAFGAGGEMGQYIGNPRSGVRYRKTTQLGAAGLGDALGGTGLIAVSMIYFGLDLPYSKEVVNWVKDRINQPYQTTQYVMLGTGIIILATRAAR